MMLRWFNRLRCRCGVWVLRRGWSRSIFFARLITPSIDSIIAHSPRRAAPLPLPPRSHLIYHQASVDSLCVRNCLESLAPQISAEDEVLFLDVGGTASIEALEPFRHHAWRSFSACETPRPEQRSYTYGLNAAMAALKAPILFVWRTDYVYPPDLLAGYCQSLERGARFASPYDVLVGRAGVDSQFVRSHWDRVRPFDEGFWEGHSERASLYEWQDPALFAIRRELWDEVGGLNHQLWGYGWQFAELSARLRLACSERQLSYFATPAPLHQTHGGSQMHRPTDGEAEVQAGIRRFQDFLGGDAVYQIYRLKQKLPPRPPS
jgi:hypothetical protein